MHEGMWLLCLKPQSVWFAVSCVVIQRRATYFGLLISQVLCVLCVYWTLSKTNERRLSLFERKVLGCIFGAKKEDGTWRKRYNYELYKKIK
jgi:hypothetical protein